MSYYFPSVDPIYLLKREGTDDDPFLFLIDTGNVSNQVYTMKEIPSHTLGIKVLDGDTEMIETDSDAPTSNQYRVDYSVGILHFHSSMNSRQITAEYHGLGYVNIPTSRIIMPGNDGDPIETLQNALDRVDDAISVLGEVGDLDFKDEYNPTSAYKKWNFVTYDNKTWVAVQDSTGIAPNENSHWRLVSSGVGAAGVHNPDVTYTIGDMVSSEDKKNVYVSKAVDNNSPLSDTTKWELIITLSDTVEDLTNLIDGKIDELNSLRNQLTEADRQRDENDLGRDSLLNDALVTMNEVMSSHSTNENTRDSNELDRKSEENRRVASEESRRASESTREINESTRQSREASREQIFNGMATDNQALVDEVQGGMTSIGNKVVEVDIAMDEVDVVLANTEFALESMDNFNHVNEYDSLLDYKHYNIVSVDGSTYIAIQDVLAANAISIENQDYWRLLARKGRDSTEITVEGIPVDETNNISLGGLGYATENQVFEMGDDARADADLKLGDLSRLQTLRKDSIVEAINELKGRIDALVDVMP